MQSRRAAAVWRAALRPRSVPTLWEEAEALIRQAYILEPDEAAIVDSMGWIMFRLGRLAEAEQFLRRAWDLEKNAEIGAHLGEVLWVQERYDEARAAWADAARVDASNPVLQETIMRLDPES